jgi:hypothetical protein
MYDRFIGEVCAAKGAFIFLIHCHLTGGTFFHKDSFADAVIK